MNYSMLIQWSDEDQTDVVQFPEWSDWVYQPVTDGSTYEEAARKGKAALETFIEIRQQEGLALPQPHIYSSADAESRAG
jgi:antitoxin HicB